MDKETLSNYGWIVICILVLVVMIASATPFGNFIAEAVWNVGEGLFNTSQEALEVVGIGEGYAVFDNRDGTKTKLKWEELMLPENGEKYGYDAEAITDTEVGEDAFYECYCLVEIAFPEELTTIGEDAFYECVGLLSVDFPASLEIIEAGAFYECISLMKVDLRGCPQITTICEEAFCMDQSILEVYLPINIISIEEDAFCGCYGLIGVYYSGTMEQWCEVDLGDNAIEYGSSHNEISPIVCTNGAPCKYHTGGTATCQEKAQCVICECRYGDFGSHVAHNGYCKYCGVEANIETPHNPYLNNHDYVVIGTWDYSDAKSVTITITYQTESTTYDWIQITEGTDYISGNSDAQIRKYLDKNGEIKECSGRTDNTRFGGSAKTTKVFENVDMLTGSVIFRSDGSVNDYYGVKVVVTPNY